MVSCHVRGRTFRFALVRAKAPKTCDTSCVTRVAIIQPNYIPWKGYFDIIHDVDVFVFLDDVQYTVRDWRNT